MSAAENTIGCRWCSAFFEGPDRPIGCRWCSAFFEGPDRHKAYARHIQDEHPTPAGMSPAPATAKPEVAKPKFERFTRRAPAKCRLCGKSGHNITTCPTKGKAAPPAAPEEAAVPEVPNLPEVPEPGPEEKPPIDIPTDVMHDICRLLLGHSITAERRLEILGVLLP